MNYRLSDLNNYIFTMKAFIALSLTVFYAYVLGTYPLVII